MSIKGKKLYCENCSKVFTLINYEFMRSEGDLLLTSMQCPYCNECELVEYATNATNGESN